MVKVKKTSFFNEEELDELGFKSIGKNVLISNKACLYWPESISIADYVRIDDFSIISGNVSIGKHVHIAAYCGLFGGKAGIELGDFSGISSRSAIYAINDDYSGDHLTNPTVDEVFRSVKEARVVLGKHSLIGTGSTILPGVVVGTGSAIGAMSLVNKDVPEWTICAGVPAKVIKARSRNLIGLEEKMVVQQKVGDDQYK